MYAARILAGLALALLSLTTTGSAQQVNSIDLDSATLGDVIRVFGSGLGTKPKLVLVDGGAAVKKTKLKVVGSGDTGAEGGGPFVDVELKKGVLGSFSIGVKQKKSIVGESPDTIELVPPTPEALTPGTATPKDEVVVMVRDYGSLGPHVARVGDKKAKITKVQEQIVEEGGTGTLTAVTIKVPKVPNGMWPVSIQNGLGIGVLKNALQVSGSTGKVGNFAAVINLVGQKPFKAKKKLIGIDEGGGDPGEVNVGLVSGSPKKPTVFGIQMPGQIADLQAGDLFTGADQASILYSVTNKGGALCVWSTTANQAGEDFAIQVIAIDDEKMVLFVCGKARLVDPPVSAPNCGPQIQCFSGMVTAPSTVAGSAPPNGLCDPLTVATGSITGAFTSVPEKNIALFGIGGPGTCTFSTGTADNAMGTPGQVITWIVTFNPDTDTTPVTFDGIQIPSGAGLSSFTLVLADATSYTQTFDKALQSSMSVTISEVINVPSNQFGILACLRGSFTGTVTKDQGAPSEMTQSLSGSFEIPYFDNGFGQ